MPDLIWRLLGGSILNILTLGGRIRDVLLSLWSTLESTFNRWRIAFESLAGSAWYAYNGLEWFVVAVLTKLPWIVFVYLPNFVAARIGTVFPWVTNLVNWALGVARGLVNDVRVWVAGLLRAARTEVLSWVNWLAGGINTLRNTVTTIGQRVWHFLTDPQVLADWLIDAVMHAMFRWGQHNARRFGQYILQQGVRAALASARFIEGVIVDVL